MISENDWTRNDGMVKEPETPDNFLRGQLMASRSTKRQVTADHAALSYWKQADVNPIEEAFATVEEALAPRSQYTERVLQGLVSNKEIEPVIEPNPAIQMESLTSLLANSAKQKLVTNSILNHITEQPNIYEYYDENENDSPNKVQAA